MTAARGCAGGAGQQMRGSSSPTGMSSTRRVPKAVRSATRPGCAAVTTPMRAARGALRAPAQRGEHRVGRPRSATTSTILPSLASVSGS